MIITSRCSQETQVWRTKCLQPRGQTIEVLWDLANPMFFDAIFKFVLFWVGDFCWCWVWMFQHQRATEKISEWLGDFFKMITHTLPLSSKPYVLDHTLQSTTRSSYHSISLWTCRKTLFATSHLLEPFLFQNQKNTTSHHHPTTTQFNDKKISLLGGPLWLQSHITPKKVLTFSCIDTLLGLSGPALCLCFTLVPHRTTKLTEGGEGWGKGWRWMAHRGVFFEIKLLWSGRGNLCSRSYLIIFWRSVWQKWMGTVQYWLLVWNQHETHNEAGVGTYSRTFSPLLSFSSRLRTLHTGQFSR